MHDEDEGDVDTSAGVREVPARREGVSPTLIGFVIAAVLALIFVVQNARQEKIRFLFFSVTTRVWVAIAVAIALGAVLDRLFARWWRHRRER